MINTVTIKNDRDTVFTLPSQGDPKEIVLVMGSCRCVAYANYLHRYNESHGRPLRIHCIEPNDYCINSEGRGINELELAERNPNVWGAVQSATIFIHEHYENYGMFNTSADCEKNIYQFGMAAPVDVSIPNFHDRFILFSEQLQFRGDIRQQAIVHGINSVVPEMTRFGLAAVDHFAGVCRKSSLPEFGEQFLQQWRRLRYFWTGNHVSRHFNLAIFRLINEKFLHWSLDDEFWNGAATEDLFSKPCAPMTGHDVAAYGLTWDCPTEQLHL